MKPIYLGILLVALLGAVLSAMFWALLAGKWTLLFAFDFSRMN